MKVLIYVEGISDKLALAAFLQPVVESQTRVRGIGFAILPQGGKDEILRRVPLKAADHLCDHPEDWVIAMPDLHPMGQYRDTELAHNSPEELRRLLVQRFESRAEANNLSPAARQRFLVFCLKHDLEVLLLAAPDQLRKRLGTKERIEKNWHLPVEDQNDDTPPKEIVKRLFKRYRKGDAYREHLDAPWILQQADLDQVLKACPQQFGPFVARLKEIVAQAA